MPCSAQHVEQFERIAQRLADMGSVPFALYGAGRFTHDLRPTLHAPVGSIAGIIDDDPSRHGKRWALLPVMDLERAVALGVRAVVITAEHSSQDAIWSRRGTLRERGLYTLTCPSRFPSFHWDDAFFEHYEHGVAKSRGIDRVYALSYPSEDHRTFGNVIESIVQDSPRGGTFCEIGPGGGLWTDKLLPRAGTLHLVDQSSRLLYELLEHRYARELDRVKLHHDTTASLAGVPDASLDLLVSFGVFVHFKADLVHQFLAAAKRTLKPGGRAIFEFNRWNDSAIRVWQEHHRAHHVGSHCWIYYNSMDSLRASASALGLRVEPWGVDDGSHCFFAEFRHA